MTKTIAISLSLAAAATLTLIAYQRWSATDAAASEDRSAAATEDGRGSAASAGGPAARVAAAGETGRVGAVTAAAVGENAAGDSGRADRNGEGWEEFAFSFATSDAKTSLVPEEVTHDIRESGAVLRDCFDAYYSRAPELARGGQARLRVAIEQDPELGPEIADSELIAEHTTMGDDEFRECIRAAGFALRLTDPIGPAGTRMVIEVGIDHDPGRGKEVRAAFEACQADQVRRTGAAEAQDAEFVRCMTEAMERPGLLDSITFPGLPENVTAAAQECMKAAMARHPGASQAQLLADAEFARCTEKIGLHLQFDAREGDGPDPQCGAQDGGVSLVGKSVHVITTPER
jgi:hypothetical protein